MSLETELIDVDYFADEFVDVDASAELAAIEAGHDHGPQLYDSTSVFDGPGVHGFVSADCYVDSAVQCGHQNPVECIGLPDKSRHHEQHPIPTVDFNDHYQQFESSVALAEVQFHESADYSIAPPDTLIQCHECFQWFSHFADFRAHIEYCIVDALEFAVQTVADQPEAAECTYELEDDLEMLELPPVLEQMEPWPLQREESYVDPQPSSSSHFIASAVSGQFAPPSGQFVYDPNFQPVYFEGGEFVQPTTFNSTADFSTPDPQTYENESESQFLDDGSCPSTHKEVFSRPVFNTDGRLSSFISIQQPLGWAGVNSLLWKSYVRGPKKKRRSRPTKTVEPPVVIVDLDELALQASRPPDSTPSDADLSPPATAEVVQDDESKFLDMALSRIDGPSLTPYTKMTCPICSVKLYRHNYLVHFRIHSGELPYQCFWCEKQYRTSSGRKIHHRVHTGERPYRCKYCVYGTITKRNLDRHVLSTHKKYLIL